jgi:hypothetical protein
MVRAEEEGRGTVPPGIEPAWRIKFPPITLISGKIIPMSDTIHKVIQSYRLRVGRNIQSLNIRHHSVFVDLNC